MDALSIELQLFCLNLFGSGFAGLGVGVACATKDNNSPVYFEFPGDKGKTEWTLLSKRDCNGGKQHDAS